MKRVLPAIGLFFLAPLVAEYLLGDLPINLLGALFVLAPMYGGGALLVREIVRRKGGGWANILGLALAYAVFEEAFTTQTLFNPNYMHLNLHLLAPAYIPMLGISAWWTIFVLTLHTVWSISVSIGLVEALVPDRRTTPWLHGLGLGITTALFLIGAALSVAITLKQDTFMASRMQFVVSGIVCLIVIVVALRLPRRSDHSQVGVSASTPWVVGAIALATGSIFMVTPREWGWMAVAIYFVLDSAVILLVMRWSKSSNWGNLHRLALAGGAALAYAWHAFIQKPVVGGGIVNRIGNCVFAAGLIVLLVIAARKNADRTQNQF